MPFLIGSNMICANITIQILVDARLHPLVRTIFGQISIIPKSKRLAAQGYYALTQQLNDRSAVRFLSK